MTEKHKKAKTEASETDSITLRYDLPSLPTAQHKAGLAGLILMIKTMQMRKMKDVPQIVGHTATDAEFLFTMSSMQALFDDFFDAEWIEAESASKWAGKEPKRVDEIETKSDDGKVTRVKKFIYDVYQPKGEFLKTLYPSESDAWLKLWRNMLWTTLRGIPLTRKVYEDRANGNGSTVAPDTIKEINAAIAKAKQGKASVSSIASSLFIGAQDVNAEKVSFLGEPSQNFLLYFWPVSAVYFAPSSFDIKGKVKDQGYVIVVPEPYDLGSFIEDELEYFRQLDTKVSGYRPKASRIDVPSEGGLEYLYHLTRKRLSKESLADSLAAVEVYHLDKRGNNIHTLAAERIIPNANILNGYEALREQCRNPIFKRRRILNLLHDTPWFTGIDTDFASLPSEFFVWNKTKSPHHQMSFFGNDVKRKFEAIIGNIQNASKGGLSMTEDDKEELLAKRIYGLIQNYVNRRAEEKSGVKFSEFKSEKDEKGRTQYPEKYLESREKVCTDAFLAMRGRKEKDFVEYFTGTICSVPQWLPENDYLDVSRALMTDPEKVKTLSMLALSACSYRRTNSSQEKGEE